MDLKHVYTARDSMEAHFVRGLLQQEGIDAVVQGEALQETWGNLNLSSESLPSVWVPEADVARALPLVEQHRKLDQADAALETGNTGETDPIPPRPTWKCAQCGEGVEVQFDRCWKCGHPRPPGGATALA